jgi:hypothetical protein
MLPRIILFIFVFILNQHLVAQDDRYITHYDNPSALRLYKLSLPLWGSSMASHNLSFVDFTPAVHIIPAKNIYFHSAFRFMFLDQRNNERRISGTILHGNSIYKSTNSNELTTDLTLFFESHEDYGPIKHRLKMKGQKSKKAILFGKVQKKFGLRIGLDRGVTWYKLDDLEVSGLDPINGDGVYIPTGPKSSFLLYTIHRIGLCIAKSHNLRFSTSYAGYQVAASTKYFYADLLLPLRLEYEDMYISANTNQSYIARYYRQVNINENMENSPVGVAIGLRIIPHVKPLTFNAEIGIMPFIGTSARYLRVGFGLLVGRGERRLVTR